LKPRAIKPNRASKTSPGMVGTRCSPPTSVGLVRLRNARTWLLPISAEVLPARAISGDLADIARLHCGTQAAIVADASVSAVFACSLRRDTYRLLHDPIGAPMRYDACEAGHESAALYLDAVRGLPKCSGCGRPQPVADSVCGRLAM
jgi:hypothetical protein